MRPTARQFRIAAIAGGCLAAGAIVWGYLTFFATRTADFTPSPPRVPPSTSRDSRPKADDVLSKLKPGMLRVDVEAMLGPPTNVDSIQNGNGRLSYRATFSRDKLRPPLPPIDLEFDASQAGHPLLSVKAM